MEAALVLPIVVLVMVAGVALMGVVQQSQRCQQAASQAGRALSLGYSHQQAHSIALANAPPGALVHIARQSNTWTVNVSVIAHQWPLSWWGAQVPLRSQIVVPAEKQQHIWTGRAPPTSTNNLTGTSLTGAIWGN